MWKKDFSFYNYLLFYFCRKGNAQVVLELLPEGNDKYLSVIYVMQFSILLYFFTENFVNFCFSSNSFFYNFSQNFKRIRDRCA